MRCVIFHFHCKTLPQTKCLNTKYFYYFTLLKIINPQIKLLEQLYPFWVPKQRKYFLSFSSCRSCWMFWLAACSSNRITLTSDLSWFLLGHLTHRLTLTWTSGTTLSSLVLSRSSEILNHTLCNSKLHIHEFRRLEYGQSWRLLLCPKQ